MNVALTIILFAVNFKPRNAKAGCSGEIIVDKSLSFMYHKIKIKMNDCR
jgi:hypothetical protein